jgi:hypothetical protein
MLCAQNPGLTLGTREDRETRIGIDCGFFLGVVGKMPKKSPPESTRRAESILWEGGGDIVRIIHFVTFGKFQSCILDIRLMNVSARTRKRAQRVLACK